MYLHTGCIPVFDREGDASLRDPETLQSTDTAIESDVADDLVLSWDTEKT